ncbi:hypothetical protein [Janibacter anophelis]|uniref:hypothetical protein n=1 Tax=Janibacter anophelis TaxID=319054 RepID=UPI0008325BC8|nr:hypothetical protein [Janibacter anophelis]
MTDPLIKTHVRLSATLRRAAARLEDETGDVPGWVLITLMTAALVTGIWAIAGDQLKSMFESALNGVTGPDQVHD